MIFSHILQLKRCRARLLVAKLLAVECERWCATNRSIFADLGMTQGSATNDLAVIIHDCWELSFLRRLCIVE